MHQPRIPITPQPFDWIEFLSLAKLLVVDATLTASTEVKLRTAISRAYYAAFHRASKEVYPSGAPKGRGSHGEISQDFLRSPDASRRQLGADLQRLFGNRKKADYQAIITLNLPRLAEDTILGAEQLIADLNAL